MFPGDVWRSQWAFYSLTNDVLRIDWVTLPKVMMQCCIRFVREDLSEKLDSVGRCTDKEIIMNIMITYIIPVTKSSRRGRDEVP